MFVAVDLGASSTRYVSDNGVIRVIPNNMEFFETNEIIDMELNDQSVEHALEVVITRTGGNESFNDGVYPKKLLIGEMAQRYSSPNRRPNNMLAKNKQPINYYSGIVAVAMSKLYNSEDTEAVDLYLAFPPIECEKDVKDEVADNFKGHYTVEFVKLGKIVEFDIKSVNVYEESFMAVLSFFFNMNGEIRPTSKQWLQGNILSLDIGDSTTDFVLVQNGKYINRSGQSFRIGGNYVTNQVITSVNREYGYQIPIEDARQVVATGRIQAGNGYSDASKIVEKAKKNFAGQLRGLIEAYFGQMNMPLATIRAIVVSGGGSMHGQYADDNGMTHTTTLPMSEYITNELKSICPGVEVLSYGENPRMANTSGLFIRAKVNEMKKDTKQTQEVEQNQVQPQSQVEPQAQTKATEQAASATSI